MNPITDTALERVAKSGSGFYSRIASAFLELRRATSWRRISDGDAPVGFVLVAGGRAPEPQWRCAARHLGGGDYRNANGCTVHPQWWMPLPDHPEGATPTESK